MALIMQHHSGEFELGEKVLDLVLEMARD